MRRATFSLTTFVHNEDYHGDVLIEAEKNAEGVIVVPFEHLLKFVAGYVAGQKIAALEEGSVDGIFGLPPEI